MLDVEVRLRRDIFFWREVSLKMVEAYLKELNDMKQKLETFAFDYKYTLFGSEKLIDKIGTEVDREIEYCNFYIEYQQRIAEPNFGKWVFVKKEDIKLKYDWKKVEGEQWTKTNGRVKAIIQFDRSGLMVKITLKYEEDCKSLKFLSDYSDQKEALSVHVKSEKSIETKVTELKAIAETFLNQHQFPRYEPAEMHLGILKKLLCIKT